jgi:DNA (cytosine-5)-methyltransferase 1
VPEAQPAVCRVADGLADRMDRLRATGNGVVPQVAALAWSHLSARLGGADT